MSDGRALKLSAEESQQLALRVREELARRRMTRQGLADSAKLSISTLEKVLAGRRTFTLATIVRLEEGLGTKLLPASGAVPPSSGDGMTASDELGSYNRAAVQWLEGTYLTLRPSFGERNAVYAYSTDISWSETLGALIFREGDRIDTDYTQFGKVAVPHQSGHIYLVTNRHGQHRMIVVSRPTITGDMHGILTTLQSGKGAHLTPVATPIVLARIRNGEKAQFGRITQGNAAFARYAALLKRTLDDQFASFVSHC